MNSSWLRLLAYSAVSLLFVFFISTPVFSVKISTEAVEPMSGRTVAKVRSITTSKAFGTAVEEAALRINPNLGSEFLQKLKTQDVMTYIKAYRIIKETSHEGEYKITLEVDVDSLSLKNKIEDSFIDNPTDGTAIFPKKPSVNIVILKNPESNPIIMTFSTSDIEREMSTILIGSGYRVVKESSSDMKLETYIGIRTTQSEFEDTTYNTVGYVSIRARDRKGRVVTEVSDSSYVTGTNLGDTGLEALHKAAARAAKKLRSELDKTRDSRERVRTVEVSFTGLQNYIQYEKIDQILVRSVPHININSRFFMSGGTVSFLLLTKTDPEELAKIIQSALPGDVPFKLHATSYDKITFRTVH